MTSEHQREDEDGSGADENLAEEETLQTPTNNRATFINRTSNTPSFSTIFSKYSGCFLAGTISTLSFISPILMVIIPKLGGDKWRTDECETECQSLLISFCMRLLILLVGTWALFLKKPQSNMPRVFKGRASVILILFILISVYWLFYIVRIIAIKEPSYQVVVSFSSNIIDCLIFVHYLTIVIVELRHVRGGYVVKVVRSPDGASSQFSVGHISVQRLAILCLNHYHTSFQDYNPYLDRMMASRLAKMARTCDFKIYNMEPSDQPSTSHHGTSQNGGEMGDNYGDFSKNHHERDHHHPNDAIKSPTHPYDEIITPNHSQNQAQKHSNHHNGGRNHPLELMNLEEGYKRKVQKRKWRLMLAAEQSFENIRYLQVQQTNGLQLSNSYQAAQTVFAGLASPLQKYLRTTRQQPQHCVQGVIKRIQHCLLYNLSSKAFLQEYFSEGMVCGDEEDWSLLSNVNVNSGICNATNFCLRRGGVSLMIVVASLPYFKLSEADGSVFNPPNSPTLNRHSQHPPCLPPRQIHETHL